MLLKVHSLRNAAFRCETLNFYGHTILGRVEVHVAAGRLRGAAGGGGDGEPCGPSSSSF